MTFMAPVHSNRAPILYFLEQHIALVSSSNSSRYFFYSDGYYDAIKHPESLSSFRACGGGQYFDGNSCLETPLGKRMVA